MPFLPCPLHVDSGYDPGKRPLLLPLIDKNRNRVWDLLTRLVQDLLAYQLRGENRSGWSVTWSGGK